MTGALCFSVDHRGVLAISGSERRSWLNGMVSNALPESEGACHAAVLTPKGRIVADLHVVFCGEALWLDLERSEAARVATHLDRYVISEDVRIEDCSEAFARLAVEGPEAAALVSEVLGESAPLEPGSARALEWRSQPVGCAAFGLSGAPGVQLFAPRDLAEELSSALRDAGAEPGTPERLERLRVEAGIPRLGRELDEEVLPDEARLDDAISTTKGCYTGQEIVARLRSRGQVQHLLVGFRSPDLAAEWVGARVEVAGKKSGELTSFADSPTHGPIALGFARREHAEADTEVELVSESGARIAARVSELPFE